MECYPFHFNSQDRHFVDFVVQQKSILELFIMNLISSLENN